MNFSTSNEYTIEIEKPVYFFGTFNQEYNIEPYEICEPKFDAEDRLIALKYKITYVQIIGVEECVVLSASQSCSIKNLKEEELSRTALFSILQQLIIQPIRISNEKILSFIPYFEPLGEELPNGLANKLLANI